MSTVSSRQRGIGLIEILIAVVLLSIGFLAAAQMQVQSMRFSQSAYFQSQANFVAGDMVDRMRTNTTGVLKNAYDNVDTTADIADPGCDSNTCSAVQQAQQDVFDWRTNFVAVAGKPAPSMPGTEATPAKGTVTDLGDGRFRVSVSWSEVVDGEDETQTLSIFFVGES